MDEMRAIKNLITVNEASEKIGLTPQALRKAIIEGRLWAVKIGFQWAVRRPDLSAFAAARGRRGLVALRKWPKKKRKDIAGAENV